MPIDPETKRKEIAASHPSHLRCCPAALFLWFMEKNNMLYRPDGAKRIGDNALVAMTLLIAESKPADKEILTRVVTNLINKKNK